MIGMLFLAMNNIYAQAQLEIPLVISNNAPTPSSTNIWVGLDPTATNGLDPALGEANLPPLPPGGVWDVRLDIGGGVNSFRDFRNAPSFPFTGTYTSILRWQQQTGANTVTIAYNMPTNSTITIQDQFGGVLVNSGPLSGSGSFTITNAALSAANLILDYNGVAPTVSGPVFAVSPSSPLSVGTTVSGSPITANVTVSNTGSPALNISGITSSDAQFSIAPLTASIPAGGNQVFVVTFDPTATGSQTSNLVFSHDGNNGPTTTYVVNGIGAVAGPTFAVNPASLTFSTNQGVPVSQNITVTNNGFSNPLNITSVATAAPFSVTPTSATVAPGASQVFSVTFLATAGGTFNGNLTFNHNGSTSPDVVNLTGNATSVFGLVFADEERIVKEDSTYSDIIQLNNLSATAQAIQFRLLTNKSSDDNSLITFQSIEKAGSIAADPFWNLQYEVFRGPITATGASVDSIYVLLYNLQQNAGLAPGDYDSLFKVNYYVVDLPGLVDTSKSSFRIVEEQASTYQGIPIDILGSRDEFRVKVTNRASSYGDVNGDGSIDILDLINVVDHILGRDSLDTTPTPGFTTSEFDRANIAPWVLGAPAPSPDAVVNVQDLAVIQNIILTGFYPSGTALNKPVVLAGNENNSLNKVNGNATIKLHITNEGIAVRLVSDIAIRGAQLEFESLSNNVGNIIIDSKLGGAYYNQVDDLLRVLLYDQGGNAYIEAGENYVANIPFTLENPQDISIEKIILVDINKVKIGTINVEIFYNNAPEIPVEYSLSQNYPNPFNPNTSVQFSVPKDGFVSIKVYDMLGQEIATLYSDVAKRGLYTLNWNGRDSNGNQIASGSYIYRMSASNGEFTQSKKMIFLK